MASTQLYAAQPYVQQVRRCDAGRICSKLRPLRAGRGVWRLNYTAVNPGENRDSEIERYYDYLRGGYYYGYIGCDTACYQGAGPGYIYTACYSEDPSVRAIYDNTYLFLKGTLMPGIPRVAATRFERQTDGSYRAKLALEGGSEIFGRDTVFEIVSPGQPRRRCHQR